MLYLIGQIVLCLMFTALIGVAVGWLLRGMGTARHTDLVEARWRARVAQLQHQNETAASAPALVAPPDAAAQESADDSAEVGALREQLAERERELASLRTAQAVRQQHPVDDLEQRLRETQALCQQLQGHLADQRAANDQLSRQLELAQTERETLVMRLRDNETEIGKLTNDRQHAVATVAGLQKQLRSLRSAVARGTAGTSPERTGPGTSPTESSAPPTATSQPAAPQPAAPQPATPQPATPQPATPQQQSPPPAVAQPTPASRPVGSAQTSITPATPAAATGAAARAAADDTQGNLPIDRPGDDAGAYEPRWRLARAHGRADDLQAIYGIGPKLQRQLNDLGVFHFRQIASFGRRDILWVAQRLKAFPGRILRDRWVEQARALAAGKRDESG